MAPRRAAAIAPVRRAGKPAFAALRLAVSAGPAAPRLHGAALKVAAGEAFDGPAAPAALAEPADLLLGALEQSVEPGGHVSRALQRDLFERTGLGPLEFARAFDALAERGSLLKLDDGTHVFFREEAEDRQMVLWAVQILNEGTDQTRFIAYFTLTGAVLSIGDAGSRHTAENSRQILILHDNFSLWALRKALGVFLGEARGSARENAAASGALESLRGAFFSAGRKPALPPSLVPALKAILRGMEARSPKESFLRGACEHLPEFLDKLSGF
jgi:hypothetical protein